MSPSVWLARLAAARATSNRLGSVGGASAKPCTCAPSAAQPQRQPAALEAGVAGDEDAPAAPEVASAHAQVFHGAAAAGPQLLRAGSCRAACPSAARSRRCLNAISSPVARPGAQRLALPDGAVAVDVGRGTRGDSTKKPPLIQPPSPTGFSTKPLTPSSARHAQARRSGRAAAPRSPWRACRGAMEGDQRRRCRRRPRRRRR